MPSRTRSTNAAHHRKLIKIAAGTGTHRHEHFHDLQVHGFGPVPPIRQDRPPRGAMVSGRNTPLHQHAPAEPLDATSAIADRPQSGLQGLVRDGSDRSIRSRSPGAWRVSLDTRRGLPAAAQSSGGGTSSSPSDGGGARRGSTPCGRLPSRGRGDARAPPRPPLVVVAERDPLGPRRLPPPFLVVHADTGVNAYIAEADDRVVDVDQLVPDGPHRLVHIVRRPERPVEGSERGRVSSDRGGARRGSTPSERRPSGG